MVTWGHDDMATWRHAPHEARLPYSRYSEAALPTLGRKVHKKARCQLRFTAVQIMFLCCPAAGAGASAGIHADSRYDVLPLDNYR